MPWALRPVLPPWGSGAVGAPSGGCDRLHSASGGSQAMPAASSLAWPLKASTTHFRHFRGQRCAQRIAWGRCWGCGMRRAAKGLRSIPLWSGCCERRTGGGMQCPVRKRSGQSAAHQEENELESARSRQLLIFAREIQYHRAGAHTRQRRLRKSTSNPVSPNHVKMNCRR